MTTKLRSMVSRWDLTDVFATCTYDLDIIIISRVNK